MAQNKLDLLHQVNKLRDYIDEHFESITEHKAQQARYKLNEVWRELGRRKGERV